MKPRMISVDQKITNTQENVKKLQEQIISSVSQDLGGESINFIESMSDAIKNVSENQQKSAQMTKKF